MDLMMPLKTKRLKTSSALGNKTALGCVPACSFTHPAAHSSLASMGTTLICDVGYTSFWLSRLYIPAGQNDIGMFVQL